MGFPAIPALEQNYQYQNYGQGSKIGRLGGLQVGGFQPTGGAEQGVATGRALDNAPRGQAFTYEENIPPTAGREAGISTWSLYC